MLIVVGFVPPFKERILNNMELINEAFVLITNYHLLTFTEFLSDIETRQHMGTSLIVTTVFNLLINLGVISGVTLAIFSRKLKLRYLKWK